jgi:hypothetical protein
MVRGWRSQARPGNAAARPTQPMAKRHYRIDSQLLTLSFFVAMPLAAFGAFIVVSMARGALQDSLGSDLEQRALQTRILVERYVGDQILHVRLVSLDPQVREAILGSSPAASRKRRTAASSASLLTSPLAVQLRETARVVPSLRLIQIIGTDGHLVATSARSGRLMHTDAPWYGPMVREESFRPYVGDLWRPAGGSEAFLEIVYPVWHPETGHWIGGVRALVAASDLSGVLTPVRIASSERAVLLRERDGLVLASDDDESVLTETYAGFEALQAALQLRRGYCLVPAAIGPSVSSRGPRPRPARLAGLSVVEQVPGVNWLVVVERDLREAIAPVQGVTRYLWWHFIGAFAAVFLLAIYLSLRQETPIIEEAFHLHEDHVPPSMGRPAEESTPSRGANGAPMGDSRT